MSAADTSWSVNAAPLFAALGDETRLQLLTRLGSQESDITTLSVDAEISRQAITKHLSVLCQAGLVMDRKLGRRRLWKLKPRRLDEAKEYLDRIGAQWDEALARLADFVESEE